MKLSFDEITRLLAIGLISTCLVACDDDDDDETTDPQQEQRDQGEEEEHDHGTVLITQAANTSISMFEEEERGLEALEGNLTTNGARFVQSDNLEFAAIIDGESIKFAGENGLIAGKKLDGENVIASNGHFSILNAGSSTLLEVDSLEKDSLEPSDTSGLGVTETFPALVLDEKDDVKLLFVNGDAVIYKANVAVADAGFDCANPSAVAQAHHAAVISCDEGATLLQFKEEGGTFSYETTLLSLDGEGSDYIWSSTDHVIAGYVPGTINYALIHIKEHSESEEASEEEFELIQGSDKDAEALTTNICTAGLEPADSAFLILQVDAEIIKFTALDSEGVKNKNIFLTDESTSTECDDYSMPITADAAFVFDTAASYFYEIDVEEDDNLGKYHVHEQFKVSVSDIASSVILSHDEDGHSDDK